MTDSRVGEVQAAVEQLQVQAGQATELRVPKCPTRYRPVVASGVFDDPAKLAQAAVQLEDDGAPGIYVTLNEIDEALLCRGYNRIVQNPQSTTADHNVVRRVWLPLDIDPVRPAGCSASDDEIELARRRALEVAKWLAKTLEAEPDVWAFSGNGFHLLTRIDLPNDDASTNFVRSVIGAASDKFSDDKVEIDRTVYNAARIWKLYGTLARKGDQVKRLGRVHRRAHILQKGFES